jgi:hypothetical protein
MIPAQEAPGYYWRTNDAADLAFNEAGPQPPTHISCYNLHDTLNRGEIAQVPIAELHFLAKTHFGVRNVGWTGDAYRFGIYRFSRQFGRPEIVIIVSHGGGMEAYLLSDLVAHQTWKPCSRALERGSTVESLLRDHAGATRRQERSHSYRDAALP